MQPGWAVVRRTNCQGCPLCSFGCIGMCKSAGACAGEGGLCSHGPGAGGFSQVWINCLPCQTTLLSGGCWVHLWLRSDWNGTKMKGLTPRRDWTRDRNTVSHEREECHGRAWKPDRFSSTRLSGSGFALRGPASEGLRQISYHLTNSHCLLYCFNVTYINLTTL